MKLIKRLLLAVFILALLAILVSPAWYFYLHPEALVAPTPNSAYNEMSFSGIQSAHTGDENPETILAVNTPTPPVESEAVSVTITAETVNLRFSTGVASGDYLSRGDAVILKWDGDGYGTIISPSRYAGLKVWRGCTSDTGDLGCEAK
jgi:hypothetical protein